MPVQAKKVGDALRQVWEDLTKASRNLSFHEQRLARLVSSLLIVSIALLIGGRIIRLAVGIESYTFFHITTNINIAILAAAYLVSRTRHYRAAAICAIGGVQMTIFAQTLYQAHMNPSKLTDAIIWSAGLLLIGNLVLSWRVMLGMAMANVMALLMLPRIVAGLTYSEVRIGFEFVAGMSLFIIIVGALRRRDLVQIEEQAMELRANEERYRTLLEASLEALVIHEQGIIRDVNDAFTRITGYTRDEVTGMRTIDLVAPDAREAIQALFSPLIGDIKYYETVVLHKNGQRVDAEIRSRNIYYHGKLVRVIAARDITESKRMREQLKNILDNFDRVFFSINGMDSSVNLISAGCEKLYGYPPDYFYAHPDVWFQVVHPDDLPRFQTELQDMLSKGRDLYRYRIIRRDGEIRWVEVYMIPALDAGGMLLRLDGIVTDITEQRLVEGRTRELESERERSLVLRQFITDASHDLRTPLATMYTSLYLLRRLSPEDDERIQHHIQTLEDQSFHLSRVLEDLFTMSRLDDPASYVEKEAVDLNYVVETVIKGLSGVAQERRLKVQYEHCPNPVWVLADHEYLGQAVRNILTNALHYSPAESAIRVIVKRNDGKMVEVVVEDNGIGIQAEELPYIFDRFYRSDKARQTEKGGVGLGLPLAKKIVEVHGGEIKAESIPNKGSTFRILLPAMLE